MNEIIKCKYVSNYIDIPENIKCLDTIYIAKNDKEKWIVFACPCGKCDQKIILNQANPPYWEFILMKNKITISNSLNQPISGCFDKFHLRNNNIEWIN